MNEQQRKVEVKIGGFGGQGIILSGIIVGKASAIYDQNFACLIKSYGPEARGGACNTQVIISKSQILYPYVIVPDALVVMSQEAYQKFGLEMDSRSVLLYDEDLVKLNPKPKTDKIFAIPATRFAEDLGKKVVTNIIMLGFFASVSEAVSKNALAQSIENTVPKGTIDLNLRAYDKGFDYGLSLLEQCTDFIPPGRQLA